MFVVIGNPPYNASQDNENDNNKNRPHAAVDTRVRNTFAANSSAQLKNKLYDPYVKAFRWAMDKLGDEGIVAFVTNNSFIDAQMFDGMRKHLSEEFDTLYILDLGGNVRKGQPGDANVFGIQVGISVNIFVKSSRHSPYAVTKSSRHSPCAVTAEGASRMLYNDETAELNKARTFAFLDENQHIGNIEWQELTPDKRHTWLTADLHTDFDTFIPMGSKVTKSTRGDIKDTIFKTYSLGVMTARDAWAYNFNANALTENLTQMMKHYNGQVFQWGQRHNREITVNDFIDTDDTKIKWTRSLKSNLKTGKLAEFSAANVRTSIYRPFTKSHLYFGRMMNECVYVFPSIFPTPEAELENRAICASGLGHDIFGVILPIKSQITNFQTPRTVGLNAFHSIPMMRMAQIVKRISRIGR